MRVAQRIVFYGIGFIIGLILLMFFLGGKNTSCDYGPEARVLKNIRLKKRAFTAESLQTLASQGLDTSIISALLINGSVIFSESITNLDSCNIYVIDGYKENKYLKFEVENCEEVATIVQASFQEN